MSINMVVLGSSESDKVLILNGPIVMCSVTKLDNSDDVNNMLEFRLSDSKSSAQTDDDMAAVIGGMLQYLSIRWTKDIPPVNSSYSIYDVPVDYDGVTIHSADRGTIKC